MDISKTTCQEAKMTDPNDDTKYIECGRRGFTVIWHQRDGKHVYVMCEMCAYHSIKNRGAEELVLKEK